MLLTELQKLRLLKSLQLPEGSNVEDVLKDATILLPAWLKNYAYFVDLYKVTPWDDPAHQRIKKDLDDCATIVQMLETHIAASLDTWPIAIGYHLHLGRVVESTNLIKEMALAYDSEQYGRFITASKFNWPLSHPYHFVMRFNDPEERKEALALLKQDHLLSQPFPPSLFDIIAKEFPVQSATQQQK